MVVCLWANLLKAWAGLQKAQFLVISRFMNSYQNKFSFHQTSKGAVKTLIYLIYSNLPTQKYISTWNCGSFFVRNSLESLLGCKRPHFYCQKSDRCNDKGAHCESLNIYILNRKLWNVSQCIAMCDNLTCVLLLIFSFYPFHFFQYQN